MRGDKSQTDGGSGLGLSISKSFTEACGGIFNIEIDGDMFKAIVEMPIIQEDTAEKPMTKRNSVNNKTVENDKHSPPFYI